MEINDQNDDCNIDILHDGNLWELTQSQFGFSVLLFKSRNTLEDNTDNNVDD